VTPLAYLVVAAGALLASTVSGVIGVGGGMIFLPFLVWAFGVKMAVPYLTLLLLVSNVSRAWFSRSEIDWRLVAYFSAGAIPGAVIGALLYTQLSTVVITKALGVYLITYVFLNFTKSTWPKSAPLKAFVPIGALAGFVSAVVGGSGPIVVPWMLRYGLVKEAFLGSEAVCSTVIHVTKLVVWSSTRLIHLNDVVMLFPLSVLMVAGSYFGKILVGRMDVRVFRTALVFALAAIGIRFLVY
jgi:uncharacterized membrane protein YfcA